MSVITDYKLATYYSLWYHDLNDNNWSLNSYTKITEIYSIRDFWSIYKSIENFLNGIFFLMRENIPPVWESAENLNGGYWTFKINNDILMDSWVYLSIQCITQNLIKIDQNSNNEHQINGLSISPKQGNSIIKIWNNKIKFNDPKLLDINVEKFDMSMSFYRAHKQHKDVLKKINSSVKL